MLQTKGLSYMIPTASDCASMLNRRDHIPKLKETQGLFLKMSPNPCYSQGLSDISPKTLTSADEHSMEGEIYALHFKKNFDIAPICPCLHKQLNSRRSYNITQRIHPTEAIEQFCAYNLNRDINYWARDIKDAIKCLHAIAWYRKYLQMNLNYLKSPLRWSFEELRSHYLRSLEIISTTAWDSKEKDKSIYRQLFEMMDCRAVNGSAKWWMRTSNKLVAA